MFFVQWGSRLPDCDGNTCDDNRCDDNRCQATGARCTLSTLTPIFTFWLKKAGTDYQVGYKLASGTFSLKVFKGGPVEIKSGTNTLDSRTRRLCMDHA